MKAAILAGGAGTRLYPLTSYVPKPLIPIGSRYVIEYIIDYLKLHGITELVMLISDKESKLLENQLGNGSRFGVKMEYSVAERLGTAGALHVAADLLGERFVVYYGDVLTTMDLSAMLRFHADKNSICTLAMSTSVPIEYGLGRTNSEGRVTYFEEKPILREYPVSIGVNIVENEVLAYCKPHTDIARDVVPQLLKANKPVFGYLTDKRHYDIGTFKNLEEVRDLIERQAGLFST